MSSLHFRTIEIHRMDGLRDGVRLVDLSAGVNVIYGPNGIGKSRTAAALNMSLWPRALREPRARVSAALAINGDEWSVDLDGDAVRYQRNASDVSSSPPVPEASARDRYNLALEDLLQAEDKDFARTILKESVGGYDLARAVGDLGLKDTASRAIKESEALRGAVQSVQQAEAGQRELQDRAARLEPLTRELADARAARARRPLIENALALRSAVTIHGRAADALAAFPEELSRLTGDELQNLERLRSAAETTRDQIEQRGQQIDTLRREQAALKLTAEQASDPLVFATLAHDQSALERLNQSLAAKTGELKGAFSRREDARRLLGAGTTDEQLARLTRPDLEALAALAGQIGSVRAATDASDEVTRWIGKAAPPADLDRVIEGLALLSRWLRVPEPVSIATPPATHDGAARGLAMLGMAVIIMLSALLAIFVNVYLLAAVLLASVLLPAVFPKWFQNEAPPPVAPTSPRVYIEADFDRLSLEKPATWAAPAVEERYTSMARSVAEARFEREKADRFAAMSHLRQEVAHRAHALEVERARLQGGLGIAERLDAAPLHVVAASVVRWQAAHDDCLQREAELLSLRNEHERLWTACRQRLQAFGHDPADVSALGAVVQDLRSRAEQYRAIATQIEAAERANEACRPRLAQELSQIEAFFGRLGLAPNDDDRLRRWLAQRPDYLQAVASLKDASVRVEDASRAASNDPTIQGATDEALRAELERVSETELRIDVLTAEIAAIQEQVRVAGEGSRLQDCVARRRECEDVLRDMRDRDCELAAGFVLAEHLRQITRDRNRPPVFRHAQRLFADVTRGRYQLEFDDAEVPGFRAVDTASGRGLDLNQLSSGTRLQLLLSVRIAFVEELEAGIKLPLILDETLGNCDEVRAKAVIEAAIRIGGDGRQIFYFTAQPDEAAKWRDHLAGSDVPHRLIDLAAVRGADAVERTPLDQIAGAVTPDVPSPLGLSREAYARLLEVPGLDLLGGDVGSTHLWHLLDDMELLHRLLQSGIRTWGPWQTLQPGVTAPGDARAFETAAARAKMIEAIMRARRIGIGKPVDRQALSDSRQISQRFFESVVSLADSVGGDATRLIESLEGKKVRNFRIEAITGLKTWLEEHDYLDPRLPLSDDQVRVRALSAVATEVQKGVVAAGDVERYLPTRPADALISMDRPRLEA